MGLTRIKAPLSAFNWAIALLGAFVSLGTFLSGLEAFAGGLGTTGTVVFPGPPPAWTDSSKYVECGQDCLYQKANENVTLQAIYLIKKMDNLRGVLNGGKPTDYSQITSELHIYCPDVTSGSKDENEANLCYRRYVQTQLPILRAMKTTLVQNEDMTAQLKTDQGLMGAGSSKHFQDETQGVRKAQTPEFERENDLLMNPQPGVDRLKYLTQQNYAQWANDVWKSAPKPADFPKTQEVLKDPTDPNSIKISKIVRNPDGSPVSDKGAYDLAKREFDAHVMGKNLAGAQTDLDLRKVALQKGYGKMLLKDIDPSLPNIVTTPGSKVQRQMPTDLELVSYRQARNLAVESEAKLFARGVMPTQVFSGDRKTAAASAAAAAKKTATTSATPGSPSTQASRTDNNQLIVAQGYYQVVTQAKTNTGETILPPLSPSGANNSVYNVTLSPEEIDKTIGSFQAHAESLIVK